MPMLPSEYKPPFYFRNGHLSTIYPALFRKVSTPKYERERLELPDGDFLDLDWINASHKRTAILCHGLEANSEVGYMKGMALAMAQNGWNVVCMNFRSCSGEPNRLARSYHSGVTEDLDFVVRHVLNKKHIKELALVGFSLGGNVVLKYLGEDPKKIPKELIKAAAVSVPCDLKAGAENLERLTNRIYMQRFLKSLKRKIANKINQGLWQASKQQIMKMRTFRDIDDLYTAPVHGFKDAETYWAKCSSKQFIRNITTPTYLITSVDDPFFTKECLPVEEARDNPNFYFEISKYGGHLGFPVLNGSNIYYHEKRIVAFLNEKL